MNIKPKAYSYLRFSTPDQMKGDSFRRQTELSRKYAEENNLDLDDTLNLQDLGVSAFRGRNAEEGALSVFLEAVHQGKVKKGSYLLVESLDRLSRQSPYRAFQQFSSILDMGVNIVTLQDRKVYSANEGDLAFSDLMISIAIMQRAYDESLTKSKRLSESWKEKRRKATAGEQKLTSRCPAWLKLDKKNNEYVVIEERAEVVRRIFKMTLEGIGKRKIAMTLNEEGIKPFGRSKGWIYSYVDKILQNEAVIGRYQPHKMKDVEGKRRRVPVGDPIDNYFPTVVPLETFLRALKIRKSKAVPGGNIAKKYSNLFSGICYCGSCGGKMHFENKGKPPKGGSYLVCSHARMNLNCKRYAWRYPETQAHIILNLLELDYRELFPSVFENCRESVQKLEDSVNTTESRLNATQSKIERLTDLLLERPDSNALLTRLDALEEERDKLQESLAKYQSDLANEQERYESVGKEYEELESAMIKFITIEREGSESDKLDVRRKLFHLLRKSIDKIVFTPATPEEKAHGTISISMKGIKGKPRKILVKEGQKDSEGYNGEGLSMPEVVVVDAQWPPVDRILNGAALRDIFLQG
ncbi:recombinase family protein [Maridesulfovibrio sp.]|uniref:recombinase family protein n=1 Tax=Maridesulfovibrio sp. TaxID=2795000 RepID=UPI002A18ACFB|nr:recombinase family protein [Maridesulfovibrio sp.]